MKTSGMKTEMTFLMNMMTSMISSHILTLTKNDKIIFWEAYIDTPLFLYDHKDFYVYVSSVGKKLKKGKEKNGFI